MKRVWRAKHTPLGFRHVRLLEVPRRERDVILCIGETNRGEKGPLVWQNLEAYHEEQILMTIGTVLSGGVSRFQCDGRNVLFLNHLFEVRPEIQPSASEYDTESSLAAQAPAPVDLAWDRTELQAPRVASSRPMKAPESRRPPAARPRRSARRKRHLVDPETLNYDED